MRQRAATGAACGPALVAQPLVVAADERIPLPDAIDPDRPLLFLAFGAGDAGLRMPADKGRSITARCSRRWILSVLLGGPMSPNLRTAQS